MTTDPDTPDPQDIDTLTVTLRPIPSIMPGIPASVRLRRALKTLLRRYGLRASWPTSPAGRVDVPPKGRRRAGAAGRRQGIDCGEGVGKGGGL